MNLHSFYFQWASALEKGTELRSLRGLSARAWSVAVTADGKRAVSGSIDATIRVWDIETGECLCRFTCDGAIYSCAVSQDGKTLVAGEDSGRVHFFTLVDK